MNQFTLRFPALTLASLRQEYADGRSVADVLAEVYRRIAARGDDFVWLHLPPIEELLASAPGDRSLPLFGVPFAVKDNIDVAGWPTTAACPDYSYIAKEDAPVVARLRAAGAIPVGKTNMDQFATGLVGVRSPHGACRSVFDAEHISGGSSSGSAVAVACGEVAFSLGTDTAGSGRVPAAFNGIVGLKPTCGLLSTRGVVPACRSLDCVSIFASNVGDAKSVFDVAKGFDAHDPFSRKSDASAIWPATPRIGVLPESQREFFGHPENAEVYAAALQRCVEMGAEILEIDYTPFRDAAALLYSGPRVAERLAALEGFLKSHSDSFFPVTRQIIAGAAKWTAADAYRAEEELRRLRRVTDDAWQKMDAYLLPTAPFLPRLAEVLAEPLAVNSQLGTYTNFVNLLDCAAIAIPAGFPESTGLPFGITLIGRANSDAYLASLASRFCGEPSSAPQTQILLAVVGAHLRGQPLNHQLTSRGAVFRRATRTARHYRLYRLPETTPPKPGLRRAPGFEGEGIDVEIWELTPRAFGEFVAEVPAPMGIGNVELADGATVKGFLCETFALDGAEEITAHSGWLAYLKSRSAS